MYDDVEFIASLYAKKQYDDLIAERFAKYGLEVESFHPEEAVLYMYKNRNSLTKIGHKFKVSKTKITSVLKQEGISIRTLSDIATNRVFLNLLDHS